MLEKSKNGTKLESAILQAIHGSGRQDDAQMDQNAIYPRGVLSGIVLRGGESPPQGEGPDGSTQPAKETDAGHAGSESRQPTSLQGIANRAKESQSHRFRNLYQSLTVEALMQSWLGLNKSAASGVDNITAEAYQGNLEANLANLAERLKTKRYRAKLVRRCYIPKENGKQRPLGIPALEGSGVRERGQALHFTFV